MHAGVFVGVLAEVGVVALAWTTAPLLARVMAISCLVAGLGVLLMARGRSQLGSRLVMFGSLVFIPIGLVAVWGAIRTLDGVEERAFAQRRGR